MDERQQQLLREDSSLAEVLNVYQDLLEQVAMNRDDEEQGTRWTSRITEQLEVSTAELSNIHGRLIAEGWLTFQLEDRNSGLMYRLTKEGRQACDWSEKHLIEESTQDAA